MISIASLLELSAWSPSERKQLKGVPPYVVSSSMDRKSNALAAHLLRKKNWTGKDIKMFKRSNSLKHGAIKMLKQVPGNIGQYQ